MTVRIQLWSYLKDLAGAETLELDVPEDSTIQDVLERLYAAHPKLETMRASTMTAIDLEYREREHRLRANDTLSLLPPVQGG